MKIDPHTSLERADSALPVAPGEEPSGAWHALGAFRVLRHRNYALLFWGQFISATGTQMQVVAVAWQVYLLTHSALALGLIGLMQALPRLLFSLVGGVLADVLDRRKLLLIVNLVMLLFSAILALLTLDFCATFFGAPRALLPVYARDIMHIGRLALGSCWPQAEWVRWR